MAIEGSIFRTGQTIVTGYDKIDIATGRGIVTLYGGLIGVQSGGDYRWSTQRFYGSRTTIKVNSGNMTADTWTDITEKDFDLAIEKPLFIDGECVISVMCFMEADDTASYDSRLIYTFIDFDGSTETQVAQKTSANSLSFGVLNDGNRIFARVTDYIDISHLYKKGHTFRVSIKIQGKTDVGATSATFGYGVDPMNRDKTAEETEDYSVANSPTGFKEDPIQPEMILQIPVKLDI